MIKAIIFDCFGVLTTDTWNAFLDQLPEGVDIQAARAVHRTYDAGLITKADCNRQIKAITGQIFTELEDMQAGVVKNHALLDYIATLKDLYKIGLLSNVSSNWIREEFLTMREQRLFDDMVFSYEVGTVKPDPEIFKLTVKRLGIRPAEAVLIDDKADYCQAATGVGMQAIVYQNFVQMKSDLEKILG